MKHQFVLCLFVGFWLNTGFAKEEPSTSLSSTASPSTEVTIKNETSNKNAVLEATVGKYMEAWQKQDYKTMRSYESWEGGEELDENNYLKTRDANFKIDTWKITKVFPAEGNQYKVLVLITHNPPKEIAGFVPMGQMVRSTLNLWWTKQGEKFMHLFHIERQKLLQTAPPPGMPSPLPPFGSPAQEKKSAH